MSSKDKVVIQLVIFFLDLHGENELETIFPEPLKKWAVTIVFKDTNQCVEGGDGEDSQSGQCSFGWAAGRGQEALGIW